VRVRITSPATGGVSLEITDPGGTPVLSVESFRSRPVSGADLGPRAEDLLHTVEWTPVAATEAQYSTVEVTELGELTEVPDAVVLPVAGRRIRLTAAA